MNHFRYTLGNGLRRARRHSGLALLASCFWFAAESQATCLGNPDPAIRQLQTLLNKNAAQALEQTKREIESLGHASGTDAARLASLYAVQAQSYSLLELDSDARAAASKGLKLASNVNDPVHLDLLSAHAENVYDRAGIDQAIQSIESARAAQPAGSLADTCLLITLGNLQYRRDHAELAVGSLTQAYRTSAAAAWSEQRVIAAAALSPVMRAMGDYGQALALNQEVVDWHIARGATLNLSVARYLRGAIFLEMRDYNAASEQWRQARELSTRLNDQQGIAFAELRICEAQIELGQPDAARPRCEKSLGVFRATQSADMVKEAQSLLAHIDFATGKPDLALAELNDILSDDGKNISPRRLASIYRLRARTNAALGKYGDAYNDLDRYMQRYVTVNDADRTRQAAILRARFETDRAIERNASLQRELASSLERSQRQKEQLRWVAIGITAGVLLIMMLTYTVIANARHRRQLLRLAGQDGLTGLPNRRHTAELAAAALAESTYAHEPLTVALIDLDHFKAINDQAGHAGGDFVLKEFARRSRESLRSSDIFGRWGGEEFLVVMPATTLDVALLTLERIRALALEIRPPGKPGVRVSMSAGLATNEDDVKSLDAIIARADAALYRAKNDGRDLVRIADESYRAASTGVRRAIH